MIYPLDLNYFILQNPAKSIMDVLAGLELSESIDAQDDMNFPSHSGLKLNPKARSCELGQYILLTELLEDLTVYFIVIHLQP